LLLDLRLPIASASIDASPTESRWTAGAHASVEPAT